MIWRLCERGGPGNMNDNHGLLAEVVERRRARPWMHVTSDGLPHFYVRTAPYDPDDLDMAAALRARDADRERLATIVHGMLCTVDDYGLDADTLAIHIDALRAAVSSPSGATDSTHLDGPCDDDACHFCRTERYLPGGDLHAD